MRAEYMTHRARDAMSQVLLSSAVRRALRRPRAALYVSAGVLAAGIAVGVEAAPAAFPAIIELSSLDGTNGDGVDDLLIGAPDADPSGLGDAGQSYVVFGRSSTQ